jgi:hypothetical protein
MEASTMGTQSEQRLARAEMQALEEERLEIPATMENPEYGEPVPASAVQIVD